MQLPKVYPITDTEISGKTHKEQVMCLIEGGASLIQIRDKSASSGRFYAKALEALKIARSNNVKIIINDRCDIAYLIGADGVHLGQDDISPVEARKFLGPNAIIGYSTHNQYQALEALKMPIDYISVGPIFATNTKEDPDPIVGLDGLRAIRKLIKELPIVAIGGINLQNAKSVFDAGADSIAIISDLLSSEDIAQRMEAFNKI